MLVRLALVLEGQTTVRHVVQVLEPFEVGDSHTASVNVKVGDDEDVSVEEDLVGGWGSRAVGSFGNDLCKQFPDNVISSLRKLLKRKQTNLSLDPVSVSFVDDLLDGSRNKDVAWLVQQVLACVRLRSGESDDGSVLDFVVLQFLEPSDVKRLVRNVTEG